MEINDLIKIQLDFDRRHGFETDINTLPNKYLQISKDIVGIIGEIGEYSNIVKKINLDIDACREVSTESIKIREDSMREELIDVFIYLIRLFALTGVDVEAEYLKKLSYNEEKYKDFKLE